MSMTIRLPRSMETIGWISAARMDKGQWLHVTSIGFISDDDEMKAAKTMALVHDECQGCL